jgi:hypothetical protein
VVWSRVPAGHETKNDCAGEALSSLPGPTGPREWLHDSKSLETVNMVISLAGLGNKNDNDGEGQQKFTGLGPGPGTGHTLSCDLS